MMIFFPFSSTTPTAYFFPYIEGIKIAPQKGILTCPPCVCLDNVKKKHAVALAEIYPVHAKVI